MGGLRLDGGEGRGWVGWSWMEVRGEGGWVGVRTAL